MADISEEEEEEENDMVGNEELKEGVEKNSVDEKTAGHLNKRAAMVKPKRRTSWMKV